MKEEEYKSKFYFYARYERANYIYSLKEFEEVQETYLGLNVYLPGNLVTVCILKDENNNTARGLSVLSINDSFVLQVGMDDAENKAIRAIKDRKLEKEYSDQRAIRVLLGTRCPFTFPAEKNPKLTLFEKRILFGKKYKERIKDETLIIKMNRFVTNGDCIVGQAGDNIHCGDLVRLDKYGKIVPYTSPSSSGVYTNPLSNTTFKNCKIIKAI